MTTAPRPPSSLPVLVIMGVSGVGKSTVAALLSERLGWDFAEGDALHPTANVEKMAAGHPLDDDDRWPWLEIVATWIRDHTEVGRPGIITCSALKRAYRDVLRGSDAGTAGSRTAIDPAAGPGGDVVFVHLAGPTELIGERLESRTDHFMPPALLRSQVATLEPLGSDERHIVVDVGDSPALEVDRIIAELKLLVP